MADQILTQRALNRALLARQLLLERSTLSIPGAVDQVGGLQTQYAPSGYVGLWTRLAGFERAALTAALEDRSVIQATLMRVTIHIVSRRDYWPFALGVRHARREQWRRTAMRLSGVGERDMEAAADRMRAALADGPRTVKELGDLATGFVGTLGLWVDLVRVPPAGTWERRRADRLALAEDWVGPPTATEADGLAHLVRAYLRAFGPGAWRDIASWAGISIATAKEAARGLDLRSFRDEDGGQLVDLPDAPLPDPTPPRPCGSCRTGMRTCWSTRDGPGCCQSNTGRASSRRRTRSPWGRTSSTVSSPGGGRSRTAESSSIHSKS